MREIMRKRNETNSRAKEGKGRMKWKGRGWLPDLPAAVDYRHTCSPSSSIAAVYLLGSSMLPAPDRPPYIHSRSTGDHCLSLLFQSSGPQLPRHSRHPAGLCLRTLPVKHTTRPAPMIFRLVGSASPLRLPARRQLASSPSRVPSVTSPTLPSRIHGEATCDAGKDKVRTDAHTTWPPQPNVISLIIEGRIQKEQKKPKSPRGTDTAFGNMELRSFIQDRSPTECLREMALLLLSSSLQGNA
ncbi:uncharacterized protein LOC122870737 [Siniperca chuatsi]|uniref:uncharacterized protein LOC122870737 n=1 Tax=Siniperca chuatsi TaxID=119488 RepID=UPI001CE166F5|nr:uncharacterized protein LOC122870737 [Siniperca chuatsi]